MTYETAKQLKDAGYPQGGVNMHRGFNAETGEPFVFPTLEELIEACGQGFRGVHKIDGGRIYAAEEAHPIMVLGVPTISWNTGTGLTPETAVANLWLALNKI